MRNNLMLNATIARGVQKGSKFKKQATYLIEKTIEADKRIGQFPVSKLEALKDFTSMCMSTGSELTKRKYTLLGVTIGVAGTLVVLKLKNKNRKEAK